jgi:hypothetical protein
MSQYPLNSFGFRIVPIGLLPPTSRSVIVPPGSPLSIFRSSTPTDESFNTQILMDILYKHPAPPPTDNTTQNTNFSITLTELDYQIML